ncbi:SAVED domain-containing protein [Colwellia sp. 6_MG-2023]|uniref:SAVED domain-containing protein n=1 Tax=Colwellia sp. 6_MG-2023 TaxID=3062676 RepID=UPI0026E36036|nr:SAVED domain-containing protein [Colwellia sp. 6_MG-2023]MDO6488049.1 SAVED domain-containing protein [Colwellia sp. 6_MG-2023]
MASEVTRYIKEKVKTALWGKSAGRCQFNGCNRPLYQSPITLEAVNIAEAAHIYSFSKAGPRGWGPFVTNKAELNEVGNLMLMCHDCHKTIDQDTTGKKYSADLLQKWKKEHEHRVWTVAGISLSNKSYVVFYGANIGEQKSPLQYDQAVTAMFPTKYPVSSAPLTLSMSSSLTDRDAEYWAAESKQLETVFTQQITPLISAGENIHFSLFSLAPMPLLIKLGCLFTDKISVDTYQPIREPKTWSWQVMPDNFDFIVVEPQSKQRMPVLVLSLSAHIESSRVHEVLGDDVDIWEIKTPREFQHNDFMRSPEQLALFRQAMRKVIESISAHYGLDTELNIFPAIPVSCAVELGRIRMPKASMSWRIFDQNYQTKTFNETITIHGG